MIDRYLFLEENKRESVDDNELVDAIDSYYRLEHKAYRAPLLMVLNGLLSTSSAKFHTHSCWLLPSLARLIICYDFEVRTKVKAIYNHHINPYFGTVIDSPKAGTAN